MANHASALKRIRSSEKKRARYHYQHKTAKTFIKKVLKNTNKEEVSSKLPKAMSMLDKLVKTGIIHRNKSARKKSKLACYFNSLA